MDNSGRSASSSRSRLMVHESNHFVSQPSVSVSHCPPHGSRVAMLALKTHTHTHTRHTAREREREKERERESERVVGHVLIVTKLASGSRWLDAIRQCFRRGVSASSEVATTEEGSSRSRHCRLVNLTLQLACLTLGREGTRKTVA